MDDQDYLTTREFDRWATTDRDWKERMMDRMDEQSKLNSHYSTELATIQGQQSRSAKLNGTLSAVIAAIVTGVVSAFNASGAK